MSEELAEQKPENKPGYVNVVARRLNTHDVQRWQSEIKVAVLAALPMVDRTEAHLNWMMSEYGQDRLQVWGLFSYDTEKPRFVGVLTTRLNYYPPSRKVLYIYTLHAPRHITRQGMASAFDCVINFAKEIGCTGVEALSKNPAVVALCGELGFDTEERHLYKEI